MKIQQLLRRFAIHSIVATIILGTIAGYAHAQGGSSAAPAPTAQPTPAPVTPDIAGTGSASTLPAVQSDPKPKSKINFEIGPELGVFLPTDSHTSKRFGSAWYAIGIGIGSIQRASEKGAVGFDLTIVSRYGSNSHIFVAPVGVQYIKSIGSGTGSSVPYAGFSADLVFADIRSPQDNVHSGTHETGGGSAFIGTTLGSNSYIEAKYLLNGSIEGFNLSGFNLTAGTRF